MLHGNYILPFLIGLPLLFGIIGIILGKINEKVRNYLVSLFVIIQFASVFYLLSQMSDTTVIQFSWDAFVGGGLYLKLDGFRSIHIIITSFVFMVTTILGVEYFKETSLTNFNRYLFFAMFTYGATMGVFLSANLFTTFVFFEVMTLTSYVMVIHDQKAESIKAAKTYLAVGVIGGLAMLMGLSMIYAYTGTLDMSLMPMKVDDVVNSTFIFVAGLLVLVGFGAKAGMFPLHIWLPNSYTAAPFPATTVLSSVLSKAGIFGIIVMSSSVFLHNERWGATVLILGVLTMLIGAILAVLSIDLKRTLACSSMSQIGFILVGIGMQGILGEHNALAVQGTILHIVNHSLLKLILFTIAAIIFIKTKSMNLNDIRGYGRNKPVLKFSFLIAALGITGIPFFNGYISKTLIHESIVEHLHTFTTYSITKGFYQLVEILFIITGGLTVAYMTKLFIAVFVERPDKKSKKRLDENTGYISKGSRMLLCGLTCMLPIMGMFPTQVMNPIARWGQEFMYGHNPAHAVEYFSWVNLKGAIFSIIIGMSIYLVVIRGLLMKKEKSDKKVYINRSLGGINIEDKIYKPLISTILPFIGALIARALDSICAMPLKWCLKKEDKKTFIVPPTNSHFGSYVEEDKETSDIARIIPTSLKYSLLTFGIGLIGALIYLLYFL